VATEGDEVKQRLWAVELRGFNGRMAAEGGVAENENPDDAAVENSGIGVALTWPCICHAQLAGPCEEPNAILFSVALSCHNSQV
jgi:hypothetical protein